jgi:thiamine biosynthesis lipoprotein
MDPDPFADASRYVRRMRPLLGTFVEIGLRSTAIDESAMRAAFRAIEQVQRALSFQDPDSELSRLNRSPGRFVALSPGALRVLRLARAMTSASGGLFDCTLGGLLVRRGVLPDHGGGELLDSGIAGDIELEGDRARLARPVRVTLDGIAKGYAVDCAVNALRHCGVQTGWVNAGGDLRAFGTLVLPVSRRESDGALRPLGGLREAAIASSAVGHGRADRRFPGTILDATGRRSAPGVWSVLARRAWRADTLTKVAALAPDTSREALLGRLGGRLVKPMPAMSP